MHLAYVCADPGIPYWGTKGASIHVRSFTGAMAAAGHSVTVIIARTGKRSADPPAGVRVIEVPIEQEGFFEPSAETPVEQTALLSESRQFAQNRATQDVINDIVAHTPIDVICERYSLFSTAGRECARWHNIPFVLEVNAPLVVEQREHRRLILEPLARQIERFLFASADCVVPVSAPLAGYITSVAPLAHVCVIPNGVEIDAFMAADDGARWRRQWGSSGRDTFLIGFIGSLKPWHGLDLLMDAFAEIRTSGREAKLILIGDGPLRRALEDDAFARGLKADVVFTGGLEHAEVPSAAQALDVLVAPYPPMERFYFSPLKVYEYMAAGKPIVASRIGQISDILEEGRTALLIPPGDTRALVEAITQLMQDGDLAKRIGAEARRVAQNRHSWAHRIDEWLRLLALLSPVSRPEEMKA